MILFWIIAGVLTLAAAVVLAASDRSRRARRYKNRLLVSITTM